MPTATHVQHIAIFLEVNLEGDNEISMCTSADTSGFEFIDINKLNKENSSPLILAAKNYITKNKFEYISLRYDNWEVKREKVWE